MRICLYTSTALPAIGGQEMVVDALARQFVLAGHKVVVLAPRPSWSRVRRLDDSSLPYPVVRHPRFISTRRLVKWYRRWLLELQRRERFDVIHCHAVYPPGYLAALCRQSLGCPFVITSHGDDIRADSHRLAKPVLLERHVKAIQDADVLIAISRFTRDGYERLQPAATTRIVDLHNGVDLETFSRTVPRPPDLDPAIEENQYVLFIGRLDRRKGVDVLLDALSSIPANGRVQLVIGGGGKQREFLEAQAASLEVTDRVRFVGMVHGAAKTYLMQNALCLVAPSRDWEASPLVALESFAAGKPVIASDLPGLSDLIESGRTGFLVPPESPRELASVLARIFGNPQELAPMCSRASWVAQNHSWPAIAERHLAIYRELRSGRSVKS